MKVLVAGGAGFIGTNLVKRLLEAGDIVTVVDNFCTGNRTNPEGIKTEFKDKLKVAELDICDGLPDFEDKFEVVINLASPASPPVYQALARETLRVNSRGTENLLEVAKAHGARFVQASTSEVYGNPLEHPQKESYWGNVNAYGPRSMYDEGKRYAEALIWTYRNKYELNTGIVRIFNTYGPYMNNSDGRVITNFIAQGLVGKKLTIYGDGRQSRSFCYIDDQIDAWMKMIKTDVEGPINVGNPKEITILELAEMIGEVLGIKPDYEFLPEAVDDPVRRCPDIEMARYYLGWEPKVTLEEGLKNMVQFIQGQLQSAHHSGG
jgi:dTDP-glucose 4,6-dehydratase